MHAENGSLSDFYIFTNNVIIKSRMNQFLTFQVVFWGNNSVL